MLVREKNSTVGQYRRVESAVHRGLCMNCTVSMGHLFSQCISLYLRALTAQRGRTASQLGLIAVERQLNPVKTLRLIHCLCVARSLSLSRRQTKQSVRSLPTSIPCLSSRRARSLSHKYDINSFNRGCSHVDKFFALHGMPARTSDEKGVCLSVCLSVKRVQCDKTEDRCVQIFIPYERSFSLVF